VPILVETRQDVATLYNRPMRKLVVFLFSLSLLAASCAKNDPNPGDDDDDNADTDPPTVTVSQPANGVLGNTQSVHVFFSESRQFPVTEKPQ